MKTGEGFRRWLPESPTVAREALMRHLTHTESEGPPVSTALIRAALTAPIATMDDNPSLPTTPEEIANDAAAAAAGAAVVNVRVRDTLKLRGGMPASGDAELVERPVGVARALDRAPATVAETRERLHLGDGEPPR